MAPTSKSIMLLHGWLGGPPSFGDLPRMLEARGHRVLPLFKQYDSRTRSLTLEQLADTLEAQYRRKATAPEERCVIIAHSMGGLLTRTWLLRHYFEQGKKPPVARVVECASPRNGVPANRLGDFLIRWRILPGATLVNQMQSTGPFIWDLAWGELEHAEHWPSTVAITGLPRKRTLLSRIMGGVESDSVVPAALCNPNPIFGSLQKPSAQFSPRLFRIFHEWTHNGPRGLLSHVKAAPDGSPKDANDPVLKALFKYVEAEPKDPLDSEGDDATGILKRTFIVVRVRAGSRYESSALGSIRINIPAASNPASPKCLPPVSMSRNPNPAQFLFELPEPPALPTPIRFSITCFNKEWPDEAFGLPRGVAPGQIVYLDLDDE